jgi:hypothetical protein
MGTGKLTPSRILTELNKVKHWTASDDNLESLTYKEFKQILMDNLELITYERTCKEKWNELIDFGYFKQQNQHKTAVLVQIIKVKEKLGINTEMGKSSTDLKKALPKTMIEEGI